MEPEPLQKELRRRHLKFRACLFIHYLSPNGEIYLSYSSSLQAMADKRKAKGTKPTGQRKSARQDNDSADVVADKENSQTAATSPSEWPRPRPIKKSIVPKNGVREKRLVATRSSKS